MMYIVYQLAKNKMNGDNVEIFVLQLVDGEIVQKFIRAEEINEYLKIVDKEEQEEKAKADKKKTDF